MNSQNKQVASSLVSLPFDLIHAVLCFVPDVPSLRAVISTCTTLHRAFQNAERLVTERVLSNQMGSGLLREAFVVLESSRLKNSWSRKAVEDFLQRQKLIITDQTTLPRRPWTLSRGIYVDRLYQHVRYFAADFASSALRAMFPLSRSANNGSTLTPQPSASEIHRMERTFFRFELYCNLFRKYTTVSEKRFTPKEQMELFLEQFPPWEVEQLVCVRDYLLRSIADAFNDVAEHDIVWGLVSIDFIDPGRSPNLDREYCCRDHFLSIGLEYLHHLGSAKTYDERYRLLSPNPLPESDKEFLESALQAEENEADGPDYWLDEYTPADILLLKNKPFAATGDAERDSGPYEAWRLAYAKYDHRCFYFADENWNQRRKAYVMWDLARLSGWEHYQKRWDDRTETDWYLDLENDRESPLRMEARWKSKNERERIFRLGGRGWWAWGDVSKIQWGHGVLDSARTYPPTRIGLKRVIGMT